MGSRYVQVESGTEELRDGQYTCSDHCRYWPPPLFILSVTLLQLAFFIYYSAAGEAVWVSSDVTSVGPVTSVGAVPLDSVLLYRPDRRRQVWRFVTYMVIHASWWHLIFNLMTQLVAGLPLELVHGSGRVCVIYMAGVLAGSLGTSICELGRQVYLVGASGGVYALLTAHIANVILNHHQLEFGPLRLAAVCLIAGGDLGLALYHRYAAVLPSLDPAVSYAAHLAGGMAGLSLGLVLLRRLAPKGSAPLLRYMALAVYLAFTLFAVLFNILPTAGRDYVV